MTKDALIKMTLEGGRIALFAAVAALVDYLTMVLAGMPQDGTTVVVLTVVLRLVDKFVHEHENINSKGLSPF